MARDRYVRLSKTMSYLLRHRPEEADLLLNEEGRVAIPSLLAALTQRPGLSWVTEEDLRHVAAHSDKQRFVIEGEQIGARYGHNRRLESVSPGEPVEPPEWLYHGTPRRALDAILCEGLLPQGRQFVHLSVGPEVAQEVGGRRDSQPVVLRVRARAAHEAGIPFYAPTPNTYLAPAIPPNYLVVPE